MEPSKPTPPQAPIFLPRLVPHLFPRKRQSASRSARRRRTPHRKSPIACEAAQQERDRELGEWRIEDEARRKRTRAAMEALKALDGDETQEGQEKRRQAFKRARDALVEEIRNGRLPPPTPRIALLLRENED